MAKFYITGIGITKRETVGKIGVISKTPLYEEMAVEILFTGSGDTTKIKTADIYEAIEKLKIESR